MASTVRQSTFDRDFRAARALVGAAGAAILTVPPQLLVLRLMPDAMPRIPRMFHRLLCWAFGIEIEVRGAPVRDRGVLFTVNHISWADIPVLGAHILGSFVAKSEVEGWGFFGRMSDLQRTIYVERSRRTSAGTQRSEIAERLLKGHNVILFPEGTSSVGTTVLDFKSALFSVAETDELDSADLLIQPVTIAYTRVNGLPIPLADRYKIGWIGDMDLLPHVWDFMGLGRVRAVIHYHPAVRRRDFPNRKALARHCHGEVRSGLIGALRGQEGQGT